jgi:hypothetical protein
MEKLAGHLVQNIDLSCPHFTCVSFVSVDVDDNSSAISQKALSCDSILTAAASFLTSRISDNE